MTTIVDEYLVEGPQIKVDLGDTTSATAHIATWSAEEGVNGNPSFPASTEIVLDLLPGSNPLAMNADKARATAAGLHQFADQLAGLADQLDAMGGAR